MTIVSKGISDTRVEVRRLPRQLKKLWSIQNNLHVNTIITFLFYCEHYLEKIIIALSMIYCTKFPTKTKDNCGG